MPVLGGFVSDAWAGKFRTILGSGFIYVLGLVLLPASAVDYREIFGTDDDGSYFDLTIDSRRALFLSSLIFISIGTGGIKANVGPFGAQQLLDLGEPAVKSFFNWFYWFINVGALLAYTGVAYVQQNIDFALGFTIPLVTALPPTEPLERKKRIFDKARIKYGGSYDDDMVESVKSVLRILPVFVTIILYWALYNQMQTTFYFQAERLDVSVGSVKIPAAGLNAFNTIMIIILIPIVDRGLYPCMERLGRPLSHLQRIGIGFVLASLAMVVAGVIEIARKDIMTDGGVMVQELGGEKFNASTLSVFAQVPGFALIGASEVFASICGIEFAYTQAPKSMQGVLTGLFYVTSGLGGFVADGILNAVESATSDNPWISDNVNDAHMEYYFFLLAIIMMLDFLVFLVIARFYRYRNPVTEEQEANPYINDSPAEKDEITPF
nr:hypothetical protein BaRGS_013090 [Batillaria attramentaria]